MDLDAHSITSKYSTLNIWLENLARILQGKSVIALEEGGVDHSWGIWVEGFGDT